MPKCSTEQILWKKRQAQWFRIISYSHGLWCNCGDWCYHIKKETRNPWVTTDTLSWRPIRRGPGGGGHVVDGFIVRGGGDGFEPGDIADQESLDKKQVK